MPSIAIKDQNITFKYTAKHNLLHYLVEENIAVDNPCNGKGSCGKCKIRLLEGNLPDPTEAEMKFLKKDEIDSGIRLSCYVEPQEDIVIEIIQKEGKGKILTTGYIPKFKYNPAVKKRVYKLEKPTLENQISFETSIINALDTIKFDWRLLQYSKKVDDSVTAVFHGQDLIALEDSDTTHLLYGVAIDIGTTTIVTALIDLNTGKELAIASRINPQTKYGLDVLTRITYILENDDASVEKLQHITVDTINEMIGEMCQEVEIEASSIYEIVVAANCTMLHFLLGVETASIGKSPYAPIFVKSKTLLASDIGLNISKGGKLYCLPSVSSFIGADIVAGAYVCQLHKTNKNILFIDIGTNGEIILSNNGRLLSCSCAAGPALEGMNISSGMRASVGAIEDIKILENSIDIKVIGDVEPIGICGSGILAVVRELLKVGLIKKSGVFIKKEALKENDYLYQLIQLNGRKRNFILSNFKETILITQSDVRQVQLAKGAILSGFYSLLKQANIEMDQLDKILIAGQFGAHLPADSLVGTGILPKEVKDKIAYVGNSSKTGAYMALMSLEVRQEIEALANGMDYMELGASEGYERLFAQCLMFEDHI